ncbi:MAG: peptidylprolyl isomerase [Desulfitobacterium sp.]|nr:peptidylprolyl isomerase [Desulfitobacterium sp.]
MNKIRNFIAGILVLTLILTGCSSLGGDQWAAQVNGQIISEKDLQARVLEVQKAYESMGMDFSSDQGKEMLKSIEKQILEAMISSVLVMQEVEKLNLDPNADSVIEQEKNIIAMVGDNSQYQEWLKQQAMTAEEVRSYFALSEEITKDVSVTEDDKKRFFNNNQEYYGGTGEQVKARHILVETEEEAKEIIALLEDGADFSELAKERSTDTGSKGSGGYLGTFGRGKMVPEFEKAAFSQEVGKFSTTPVQSEFGYHIILVEEYLEPTPADYEAVKDQVAQDALADAKARKFEEYFTQIRESEETKIEYAEEYNLAN